VGAKEVAVTEAKGAIDVAAFDARTEKNNLVAQARITCEADTKAAELHCLEQRKESAARKETAALLAKARVAEAAAEGAVAKASKDKVKHEHQLRLAAIDCSVAAEGRKLVSGADGKRLLSSLTDVRGELMDR